MMCQCVIIYDIFRPWFTIIFFFLIVTEPISNLNTYTYLLYIQYIHMRLSIQTVVLSPEKLYFKTICSIIVQYTSI